MQALVEAFRGLTWCTMLFMFREDVEIFEVRASDYAEDA
jgi:hypothetical protein